MVRGRAATERIVMTEPTPHASTERDSAPPSVDPLVQDNARTLQETILLLEALPEAEYAAPSRHGSTVGAHFRHVLDHYLCLLEGLESGLVYYEGRRRDPLVETDRATAMTMARELAWRLEALPAATLQRALRVRCLAGELADRLHGDHATSAPRELHFVLLHAVHHYSIIGLELKTRGYTIDADFGLAPATRAWRRTQS